MKKIILSMMLFVSTIFSSDYSLDAKYDVSYGFFGNIGVAHAYFNLDHGTYKIKIKAHATGLVKVLTKKRVESYESTGIVKNGILIPQVYVSKLIRDGKTDIKRYLFDYKKKQVTLIRTKVTDKKRSAYKKVLPYFAKNDILTLFFNLKHILGDDYAVDEELLLHAVGASDKDGRVNLRSFSGKEQKMVSKLLGKDDHLLSVTLNQKIFASPKGEMFLNLNNDGICTKAILKDVIMFGDIRGEINNMKVKR
jgi:hypothetical protein